MKILFVAKGFPSEKNPMSGNYEAVQARAIAALGHQVAVVFFHWRSLLHLFDKTKLIHRKSGNIDVYEMNGVVFRLPILSRYSRNYNMDRWMMQRSAKRYVNYYLKSYNKPDLIHIHSQFIAKFAIVLKKKFNVPVVLTEHWSGLNTGEVTKSLLSERKIYLESDAVIVVSHALQRALKDFYGIDSKVIYNMVEDRFFKDKRQIRKDNIFTFVSVGRLVPIKCFDSLIRAISLMKHGLIRLILVGGGEDYSKLRKLIRDLKLDEKIQMVGMKTSDEVSNLLCNSDCFVLSSHRETFGIVLIEAMAKGLPVISTRCGGPEDIVNERNGILVEPDNASKLAEAMDYMVEHSHEFDNEEIKNFCFENFSQEAIGNQIIDVYNEVLINCSK